MGFVFKILSLEKAQTRPLSEIVGGRVLAPSMAEKRPISRDLHPTLSMFALLAAFGSYHLTADPSTHWGCADQCGPNATLACVQSSKENEYVARFAADAGVRYFWIGNYQSPAGEEPCGGWDVCQSGETANAAKQWDVNASEPNNWRGAEACAGVGWLGKYGLWYDVPCYLELPCLCKSGAVPSPEYMAFAEVERKRDKSLRAAAIVLYYISLAVCSVVSGLSLLWALVCILREVRRKQEQSAGAPGLGAGLEMVQSDAGLGPHDQRVHASLLSRDVMLLRCSWLRSRPHGYVLPRRQDLPAEALLSPEEAAVLFARQDRRVCALTYGCAPRPATPSPAHSLTQSVSTNSRLKLHDRAHSAPPRSARREPAAHRGLSQLAHWAWLRRALLGPSELGPGMPPPSLPPPRPRSRAPPRPRRPPLPPCARTPPSPPPLSPPPVPALHTPKR